MLHCTTSDRVEFMDPDSGQKAEGMKVGERQWDRVKVEIATSWKGKRVPMFGRRKKTWQRSGPTDFHPAIEPLTT